MRGKEDVSHSIEILHANLNSVARVCEWAEIMGYDCPKKFSRNFLRHYYESPQAYLTYVRLKSIISELQKGRKSNFKIAVSHGIPDEIALNKFINYHMGCSPTEVKCMADNEIQDYLENFGSKLR